jgi:hypothetical protein
MVYPYHTTNIEEGITLANDTLYKEFDQNYPNAWMRIEHHQAFMHNIPGIHLKPEALPFSNIPAYLPPLLALTAASHANSVNFCALNVR